MHGGDILNLHKARLCPRSDSHMKYFYFKILKLEMELLDSTSFGIDQGSMRPWALEKNAGYFHACHVIDIPKMNQASDVI